MACLTSSSYLSSDLVLAVNLTLLLPSSSLPPPFLLLFFYVLTSSGHLPFFVPLPQEELKKLKITNNYLRFNFEPINQLSCLAKIYPDITLSSFYLLKLSCKQNYTVDLEIDQNIDICIISYFYTFPTNEGDKVFVTITF